MYSTRGKGKAKWVRGKVWVGGYRLVLGWAGLGKAHIQA
jgi:hypothetical protein